MSQLLDTLREDLAWVNRVDRKPVAVDWSWPRVLLKCISSRGLRAALLHRLAHSAHLKGHRIRAGLWYRCAYLWCGADISPGAKIGGGLRLPHPQGVVIGGEVEIGAMVTIGQHATLGGNLGKRDESGRIYPRIGDRCLIFAGAVVAGPIDVGHDTIIGANSVITKSVPSHVVVGGIPGKVLRAWPSGKDSQAGSTGSGEGA